MTFAHIPSGYVLAYVNERFFPKRLTAATKKQLTLLTAIGATFPDVDTLPYLTDGSAILKHRQFITHTPFLYVVLSMVVLAFASTLPKNLARRVYMFWYAFISGVFLHLATDSFVVGVRWLYPVSGEYYSLFGSPFYVSDFGELMRQYVLSVYFLPEVVFFVLAIWLFFVVRFNRD